MLEAIMTARLTTKPEQEVIVAIHALELDSVKRRLMDTEVGQGWSREYADRVEAAYKTYLTMLVKYQDDAEEILLSKDVDEFWHTHILQTAKYMRDCERVFGNYLHHDPHLDRDDAYLAKRAAMTEKTRALYEREFGGEGAGVAWYGASTGSRSAAYSGASVKPLNLAYSGASIVRHEATYSQPSIQPRGAAYSGASIGALGAAYSGASIHQRQAAYSGASIKANEAAYSGASLKPEHAAYSGASIRANEAAYSGASLKPEHAAYSGASIKANEAAYSGASIKAVDAAYSGASRRV
jgi:hypothetical protein